MAAGEEPGAIINGQLIPAINEVGVLFDKQIYFLPQLISSAQTMQQAIEYLEPMLSKDKDAEPKATIVIATVEGDIHDIGKNLVALMLRKLWLSCLRPWQGCGSRYYCGYSFKRECPDYRTFCPDDHYHDAYEGCGRAGKRAWL